MSTPFPSVGILGIEVWDVVETLWHGMSQLFVSPEPQGGAVGMDGRIGTACGLLEWWSNFDKQM